MLGEIGLANDDARDLAGNREDVVVFAPFETVAPDLTLDADGVVRFRGRRCDAIVNELTIGYLQRAGHFTMDARDLLSTEEDEAGGAVPRLRTDVVNGSTYAAFKGLQMRHFARFCAGCDELLALPYRVAADEEELAGALASAAVRGRAMVIRPFSASQGTAIVFVDERRLRDRAPLDISKQVVDGMTGAMERKYGGAAAFPVTVTPFEESMLIDGCVTDLRVFVVYDQAGGGLRALPGMVRRAQVPLGLSSRLDSDCGMTNLNAPAAPQAVSGPRIFPLADPDVLRRLGLSTDDLVSLCRHSAAMWAGAFADERFFFADRHVRQFCYGSVDFLVRACDRKAVPIEMSGANAGSHPTVHPEYCDVFGEATTAVLGNLGYRR